MKKKEEILTHIMHVLTQKYKCHTVILYGSRSRGDYTYQSDWDVIGFSSTVDELQREARKYQSQYLDLCIYPTKYALKKNCDLLHINGGKVIQEKNKFGTNLLSRLNKRFQKGPAPLSAKEIKFKKEWVQKMLCRGSKKDTEGNYRNIILLTVLVEDYFSIRNLWYLGPKESLRYLKSNDLKAYKLLDKLFINPHDRRSLSLLLKRIYG